MKAPAAETVEREEPILRSLDRWWFGYGSATTLGIFRILIAGLTFVNMMMLAPDWWDWYSETGFVPAWLGRVSLGPNQQIGISDWATTRLNLLGGVTDPRIGMAFFAAVTLAALLTSVGLWTRVSAFALALGVVCIHHRNIGVLHGGDTLMRVMVIYLAVSPCGRACSLDRLFRLRRGEETNEPVQIALWGQRLVEFNVALIYFTTVWEKWFGSKWMNGTATWYPARLAEFYRFPVPRFMNDFPMVYLTTYGTLLIEFSLATLVFFRPLRKYCVLGGIILHGGIEYSMNIPLFSYFMVSCYVCFYEGDEITAFFARLGERLRRWFGLEVFLPAGRRLTVNGERFLRAVDPFGFVRYLPGEDRLRETEALRAEAGPMLDGFTPETHLRDVDGGWDAKRDDGKRSNPFRGVAYRTPAPFAFLAGVALLLLVGVDVAIQAIGHRAFPDAPPAASLVMGLGLGLVVASYWFFDLAPALWRRSMVRSTEPVPAA